MILFLKPALTIAVEAWTSWGLFTKWFVQRGDGDDIRAIAEEISLAETDAQRNSLDVPLATLLSQIRTAAATRTARLTTSDTDTDSDSGAAAKSASDESSTTMTTVAGILRPEGGLGREKPVPVLITDANRLRDAYVEFGATYVGEDATTVLPPPKPSPPGVPTNVGLSVEDGVVLVRWDEPESGGDVVEYRVWLLSDLADGDTKSFYNVASYQGERFFEITYMVGLFGDEFSVQVRAGNRVGFSPWTEKRFFTTPPSSSG